MGNFFFTDPTGGIVGSVFGGAVGTLVIVMCVVAGIFVYQRHRKVSSQNYFSNSMQL